MAILQPQHLSQLASCHCWRSWLSDMSVDGKFVNDLILTGLIPGGKDKATFKLLLCQCTAYPVPVLLRLWSSSSHWNIGRRDSSISDGHWWFSPHVSMLPWNTVDLLWMLYAMSFVVSCHLLVSNSWLRLKVCLPTVSAHDQPVSSSVFTQFGSEVSFQTFLSAPHYSHGQFMMFPIFSRYTANVKRPKCRFPCFTCMKCYQ